MASKAGYVQGRVLFSLNLIYGCSSVTPARIQRVPRPPTIRSIFRIPPEEQKPIAPPELICQTCHRPRSKKFYRRHRTDPRSFPRNGNCSRTRCIQSRRRLRRHDDRHMIAGSIQSPRSQPALIGDHQYPFPNTRWTNGYYSLFSPDRLSSVLRGDTDASAVQMSPPSYYQSQADFRYRTGLEAVYEME